MNAKRSHTHEDVLVGHVGVLVIGGYRNTNITQKSQHALKLKCQDLDNAEAGHYMEEEDSRSCTDMYVAEIFHFHSFYKFMCFFKLLFC